MLSSAPLDYTTKGVADAVANMAMPMAPSSRCDNTYKAKLLLSKSTMQQPLPKSKGVDTPSAAVDYTTKGVAMP